MQLLAASAAGSDAVSGMLIASGTASVAEASPSASPSAELADFGVASDVAEGVAGNFAETSLLVGAVELVADLIIDQEMAVE